ncbi:MAG: endonuclease/exonuclease/phosphatase family protein [Gemmatimonadota bacterium]|nr:endonuclease/exonuclease/phosphatase family protein [Gemmatimonadota bacterium]
MRRLRSPAAVLVVLALSVCGPASRAPGAGSEVVRVLVYNIHAGKDANGADNLERVAEVIRSSGADVALLQEVDRLTTRSGRVDQPATLARLTKMRAAFGKTLDYQGGEYGIAILSRWPVLRDTLLALPVDPPQPRAGGSHEPRGALTAVAAHPAGELHLVDTHLDASANDRFRRQEATTLAALAAAILRSGATALVGGDLNTTPDGVVLPILATAGLRDAWPECGVGAGPTYPSHTPVKRIDYLLLPPALRCTAARVLESQASDHRAILFEVRRRN